MATTFHFERSKLGDWRSPLDYLDTVISAHAGWVVKNRVFSPAPITGQNRLEELWVQSTNTTSGQILAMQFRATYSGGIEVAYSRDTDLNLPWDSQPEAPKDAASREGTNGNYTFTELWGRQLAPAHTLVAISNDFIHIVWQGSHVDESANNRIICYYGALDKSHNYLDGVVWFTSHKSGKNTLGVHFNEHWYQDGFGSGVTIEGLQAKINDLSNAYMYEINYYVHGLYVNPISIHCNTGSDGIDTNLELAGFLPDGALGANYIDYPNLLIQEEIHGKKFVSMPITVAPYINTILYPVT